MRNPAERFQCGSAHSSPRGFKWKRIDEKSEAAWWTSQAISTSYLGPGMDQDPVPFSNAHDRMNAGADHCALGLGDPYIRRCVRPAGFLRIRSIFGSEQLLGWGMVIVGLLRIGRLIVNGARKNVTPHIRMFSAACGMSDLLWHILLLHAFGNCEHLARHHPPFVLCELINAYRAAKDVGESHGRHH